MASRTRLFALELRFGDRRARIVDIPLDNHGTFCSPGKVILDRKLILKHLGDQSALRIILIDFDNQLVVWRDFLYSADGGVQVNLRDWIGRFLLAERDKALFFRQTHEAADSLLRPVIRKLGSVKRVFDRVGNTVHSVAVHVLVPVLHGVLEPEHLFAGKRSIVAVVASDVETVALGEGTTVDVAATDPAAETTEGGDQ